MGVHATEHYPEIKRLLGIPEDEPIFILRAKDQASRFTVADYSIHAERVGASPEFVEDVEKSLDEIIQWQLAHPELVKVPD